MSHHLTLAPLRAHLSYTEPHPDHGAWTSPPRCLPTQAAAEAIRDAVTVLAGPGARARRTWTVGPCTCGGAR
ncbi:MAG: hypothetical protein L0I76_05750 [Pseudonocardia sp.]|nr:hypothetical protein [Pseudonocardia sp.]